MGDPNTTVVIGMSKVEQGLLVTSELRKRRYTSK